MMVMQNKTIWISSRAAWIVLSFDTVSIHRGSKRKHTIKTRLLGIGFVFRSCFFKTVMSAFHLLALVPRTPSRSWHEQSFLFLLPPCPNDETNILVK